MPRSGALLVVSSCRGSDTPSSSPSGSSSSVTSSYSALEESDRSLSSSPSSLIMDHSGGLGITLI